MACGGCGARRAAARDAADGKTTKYRVTWGDGSSDLYPTPAHAKVEMRNQSDPAKRRGMRVLSVRV